MKNTYDAAIVGAGPNGLTAANVLAAAGLSVIVLEAGDRVGGSCRTEALTLPGFAHDVCSAIHPMAVVSPAFRRFELDRFGLQWVSPPALLAHPFDNGPVALLERSMTDTAASLGEDGRAWMKLLAPFVERHEQLFAGILRPIHVPRAPWLMAHFGLLAAQSADSLVARYFAGRRARALFGGCAAHSSLALSAAGSASFGLALAVAGHAADWPCARGGSEAIVRALEVRARAHGCDIRTNVPVHTLADIPATRAVLFDVTPRQLASIAGEQLPASYLRRLGRFRYGPGVFKIDYALSEPIPWRSRECASAATVHLGGSYDEIASAEAIVASGRVAERPFVLLAQQSLFDPTRSPTGRHTGWCYCHVPHGSAVDMTDRIERQIERFAPGFRDVVLARHVMNPAALEAYNPNRIGGDIAGGSNELSQFLMRPVARWNTYTTPNPRLFLCSSSTPPGGGVHGMCGYWAAHTVLRERFDRHARRRAREHAER